MTICKYHTNSNIQIIWCKDHKYYISLFSSFELFKKDVQSDLTKKTNSPCINILTICKSAKMEFIQNISRYIKHFFDSALWIKILALLPQRKIFSVYGWNLTSLCSIALRLCSSRSCSTALCFSSCFSNSIWRLRSCSCLKTIRILLKSIQYLHHNVWFSILQSVNRRNVVVLLALMCIR
jgi:hypothetical protein